MTNSLFNQQEANKERHSWNDVVLDVPVKHIESTNITPRPWNTPQVMCDALELPVQRACWWLRELGVETLASTANAKNIGNYAGIAISISTLSSSNKTALQIFSRQNQSVLVKDDSITLQVHIPDGTTTARYISDQFINLIQEIGLEYQPAYWAAPMTPEDFLKTAMQKYGERQFQGQGHDPATTSIFEIVWAALSVDPDRNEIIIDSYIYETYKASAGLLETFGKIGLRNSSCVFEGVRDAESLAAHFGYFYDLATNQIWRAEETRDYYLHSLERAAVRDQKSLPLMIQPS